MNDDTYTRFYKKVDLEIKRVGGKPSVLYVESPFRVISSVTKQPSLVHGGQSFYYRLRL